MYAEVAAKHNYEMTKQSLVDQIEATDGIGTPDPIPKHV